MYAIGGSQHPTIISQGNRFIAPSNQATKEVHILVLAQAQTGLYTKFVLYLITYQKNKSWDLFLELILNAVLVVM